MSEVDDFLAVEIPRLKSADLALHNGDARPRSDTWSHNDPVTLFGALVTKKGWSELAATFDWLATRFSNCTSQEYEVIAAGVSGDLAYLATIERTSVSILGKPSTYALRVTHVFRREDGAWKVVHRHADEVQEPAAARDRELGAASENAGHP